MSYGYVLRSVVWGHVLRRQVVILIYSHQKKKNRNAIVFVTKIPFSIFLSLSFHCAILTTAFIWQKITAWEKIVKATWCLNLKILWRVEWSRQRLARILFCFVDRGASYYCDFKRRLAFVCVFLSQLANRRLAYCSNNNSWTEKSKEEHSTLTCLRKWFWLHV